MNWISTAQRLPGVGVRVLIWVEGHLPDFGYRNESGLWYSSHGQVWPTHWTRILPP